MLARRFLFRAGPTWAGGSREDHLTHRRRCVEQAETPIGVLEVAAGPPGREAQLVAVEEDSPLALITDADGRGLVDHDVLVAMFVGHGGVERRAGVHLAKPAIDPVHIGIALPGL